MPSPQRHFLRRSTATSILCRAGGPIIACLACSTPQAQPPCTIGQPCEVIPGQGYTYQGLPCVGSPATDNGHPQCSCDCALAYGDGSVDAADSSSQIEAGRCGNGPPGACNAVTNIGSVVTPTCVSGSAPAMTGGAIADGTYVLVSGTAYAPSCTGVTLPTGGPTTIVVSAGCLQSTDVTGGAQTATWTASGTTLTTTEVCPGSSTVALQYTATATTLSELGPLSPGTTIVSVFKRQ